MNIIFLLGRVQGHIGKIHTYRVEWICGKFSYLLQKQILILKIFKI